MSRLGTPIRSSSRLAKPRRQSPPPTLRPGSREREDFIESARARERQDARERKVQERDELEKKERERERRKQLLQEKRNQGLALVQARHTASVQQSKLNRVNKDLEKVKAEVELLNLRKTREEERLESMLQKILEEQQQVKHEFDMKIAETDENIAHIQEERSHMEHELQLRLAEVDETEIQIQQTEQALKRMDDDFWGEGMDVEGTAALATASPTNCAGNEVANRIYPRATAAAGHAPSGASNSVKTPSYPPRSTSPTFKNGDNPVRLVPFPLHGRGDSETSSNCDNPTPIATVPATAAAGNTHNMQNPALIQPAFVAGVGVGTPHIQQNNCLVRPMSYPLLPTPTSMQVMQSSTPGTPMGMVNARVPDHAWMQQAPLACVVPTRMVSGVLTNPVERMVSGNLASPVAQRR